MNGCEEEMGVESKVKANSQVLAIWKRFGLFAGCLSLLFAKPLYEWFHFALKSDTFSYVILMPAVVAYLARLKIKEKGIPPGQPSKSAAMGAAGLGVLGVVSYWAARGMGWAPSLDNSLALLIFSYVTLLMGAGFWILGAPTMRLLALPTGLLFFMIPFPTFMTNGIEIFFQHASADMSDLFFAMTGTAVFREGLYFKLPGITIQVAQECSGIRSSLVLFITSMIAGHMFLQTTWKKVFLTLFVIPLAIVRNGFRILVIALLCVHVDPEMISSPIHKRGGPLFFALSLIPFFLVLLLLKRSERAKASGRDK